MELHTSEWLDDYLRRSKDEEKEDEVEYDLV